MVPKRGLAVTSVQDLPGHGKTELEGYPQAGSIQRLSVDGLKNQTAYHTIAMMIRQEGVCSSLKWTDMVPSKCPDVRLDLF